MKFFKTQILPILSMTIKTTDLHLELDKDMIYTFAVSVMRLVVVIRL